jgi:hypothetical protein
MLLAHHLYERSKPGNPPSTEEWVEAHAAATVDATPEVEAAWDSWNDSERRISANGRAWP